eukprot:c43816_g1_i1 orf=123-359(+)
MKIDHNSTAALVDREVGMEERGRDRCGHVHIRKRKKGKVFITSKHKTNNQNRSMSQAIFPSSSHSPTIPIHLLSLSQR